jgi:hypothetical protein
MFVCDQGCIYSTDSVEKLSLNGTKRKKDKHTGICPIETLVCNCWTNDYTPDQIDTGKSVQDGAGEWHMNDSYPICCYRNKAMLIQKELSSFILNGTDRHGHLLIGS